jgi:hypothetical protein
MLGDARPATSCTGAAADNYWYVYTDAYVDIQPAIITITASSHTRVYGETSVPTVTATYTGWQNGNSEVILSTLATCSTNYSNLSTVAGGARTYCSGAVGGNYTFTYVDGAVTVTRATIMVTASSVPSRSRLRARASIR